MKKLIELLNEYEYSLFEDKSLAIQRGDIQDWIVFEKDFCKDLDKPNDSTMDVTHLISHRFGFVKWLVEQDKIDTDAYKTVYSGDLDKRKTLTMSSGGDEFYQVTEHGVYESLLMLLAIQDEPIEFLISILKNV